MVTLRKKTIKIILAIIILAILSYSGYSYWLTTLYPDIATPKLISGNPNAKVKIIEFADIQCPACKVAYPIVEQIKKDYGNNISYQYYHFPLPTIHIYAEKAAEAAECANDQGMFAEFMDVAFTRSPKLKISELKQMAIDLHLDTDKFNACLSSGRKYKTVQGDVKVGQVKDIQGTPTFFINNKKLPKWDDVTLRAAIERELKQS